MFNSQEKRAKLFDENKKKEESRALIRNMHDSMIMISKDFAYHVNDYKEHKQQQVKADNEQDELFDKICHQIDRHTCTQSYETKSIVEKLVERTKEQNGHLKAVDSHLESVETTLSTVLNIAEGRRSLWKEVGVVIGAITAIAAIAVGLLAL
jgi:vacuolar-type H+-ATPase subunit I/STV1